MRYCESSRTDRDPRDYEPQQMLSCNSGRTDRDPVDDDEPQQTSAVIAGNDDLLTEILLRLPVKSLLRFKSVSKRWFSLISNSHFSQIHCLRNPASVSGLLLVKYSSVINPEFDFVSLDENQTGSIPFRSLNFIDDAIGMKIEQSCNGLFCCSSFRANERRRTYYIYNPATKQHTTLPRPGGGVDTIVLGINLAFDPSKSPHYKAVAVCVRRTVLEIYQIEVYSSVTGSWRPSGDPFRSSNEVNFHNALYWNGAIHWVSMWGTSLYYDIERELLQKMPMPRPMPRIYAKGIRYFGESRGHMHLIEIYDPPTTQFDVLEMENSHSKWFVKYRVDLDALTIAYPETVGNSVIQIHGPLDLHRYDFSVLCLVRGRKEEEASLLVLNIRGKVISYNLEDKTFKQLHDFQPSLIGNSVKYGWHCNAYQYFETLSCV